MSKTASQLADQTLRELHKLDGVEAAAYEDSNFIQELSQTYHETLNALKINVTWDYSDIPDGVFFPLAAVLADVAARTFGVKVSEDERAARLRTLKAAAATPYLGTVNKGVYY